MFCFQKYKRHHQKLILSPQGRQQNLGLGTNPIGNAVPCFPHDNIDGNRLCDECKKSSLLVVCHMPESILWLLLQVWCLTIKKCQVVQFVPNTSMTRQFVSKLLIILQQSQVPPDWIDGHQKKDAKLCKVAPLSCLPIHSIAQRIFEHELSFRRTTLLFAREVSAIR